MKAAGILFQAAQRFKRRLHLKKSIFFTFLFSYIFIMLIPLGGSIGIFLGTRKGVQREMLATNQAILTQSAQIIDSVLRNTGSFCLDLSIKGNISSILYISPPFDDIQRYRISEVIRKDFNSISTQNYMSSYLICFNRGEFALTTSARYTLDLAYETYFSQSGFPYEEWRALMKERHYQDIYDMGGYLLYLQTIPYTGTQAAANIAVILDKGRLLSQLDQIEWVRRGMFYVVDPEGKVILTNRSPEEWEALGLAPAEGGILSGTLDGKRVYAFSQMSSENGWTYYLVMDNSYLKSSNQTLNGMFLIYLLIAAALGTLLSLLMSRRNYRPIQEVVHALGDSHPLPDNENELMFIDASVKRMIHLNADFQRQLEIKNDQICQNFLSRILRGRVNLGSLDQDMLRENQLNFTQGNFQVALFRVDDYSGYFAGMQADHEEYPLDSMDYSLIYLLRELIQERFTGYVCEVNGLIACVVNFADGKAGEILQMLRDACDFVERNLFILLTLAISGVHRSPVSICEAYDEAGIALENSIFSSPDRIFIYSAVHEPGGYGYSVELEQSLAANLRAGYFGQAKEILEELFRNSMEDNRTSLELFRCFLFDVAATFIRVIEKLGIQSDELNANRIVTQISRLRSAEQMQEYLVDTAEKICNCANEGKESHNTVLLNRILGYLWEHYMDSSLGNEQIACEMDISPAYLSRFFKQQTGEGLLNTINRIRIEEAKKLLGAQDRPPLSEIGQMVGFDNVATFIRIFKKYEGITPGKFAELS